MLGYFRQETGNEKSPNQEDVRGAYRGKTPTLLLGRLHASIEKIKGVKNYILDSDAPPSLKFRRAGRDRWNYLI